MGWGGGEGSIGEAVLAAGGRSRNTDSPVSAHGERSWQDREHRDRDADASRLGHL